MAPQAWVSGACFLCILLHDKHAPKKGVKKCSTQKRVLESGASLECLPHIGQSIQVNWLPYERWAEKLQNATPPKKNHSTEIWMGPEWQLSVYAHSLLCTCIKVAIHYKIWSYNLCPGPSGEMLGIPCKHSSCGILHWQARQMRSWRDAGDSFET